MSCVAVWDAGTRPVSAPKVTVAPGTKPVPLMVSTKPVAPAATLDGLNAVIVGTGFRATPARVAEPAAGCDAVRPTMSVAVTVAVKTWAVVPVLGPT